MRISSNLTTSRYNVYYYRSSIPVSLHPERKQTSLRVSLDTRCPREALQLSRMLGYVAEQILRKPGIWGMNHKQIRDVLHENFKSALERHRERLALNGPLPEMDRTAIINTQSLTAQALKDEDYTFVATDSQMAGFIDKYELPIKPDSKEYSILRIELLKAWRDYCGAALKENEALDGYDFTQPSPNSSKPTKLNGKKLADTVAEYCEEKLRLKKWRQTSAKGYRGQFNLLLRILGQDASLHISQDVADNVKSTLLRLPKNMSKKAAYKNMSIAELTELDLSEKQRLSAASVAKHISTYSAFYDWAVPKKKTNENNFSSLVDDVKKAHVPREDFSAEEIGRIFEKVLSAKAPHHKWGTLIAFYTGARLNEIAQLETKDIQEVDGVWCFHITDEGEQQRLKNDSSKRIIPIHYRLIELNLLDYVKRMGKGRLFPGLTYHSKDGYGRNLGRWFNDSLLRKQLQITSPSLVFHSIRHTVAQQLRNKGVQEGILKDILGHAQTGVTLALYANNLDKRVMKAAIDTLTYP